MLLFPENESCFADYGILGIFVALIIDEYMRRLLLVLLAVAMSAPLALSAQSRSTIGTSTDIAMFAPAAMGAGVAIINGDYKGLLQLGESLVASVAVSYALKYTIKKKRPDGSDSRSFPSNHTGFSFAGATFLQKRYGWKWGVPGYLVSCYVAWGRVYAKKHDAWDVLAGTAIGIGSAFALTSRYANEHEMTLAPVVDSTGGCGIHFSMKF